MNLVEISDRLAWDDFVDGNVWGHPLQLWGWGEAKRPSWTPHRLALIEGERWVGGAQVLLWPIPRMGKYIAYVPRGPVVDPGSVAAGKLLAALVNWARDNKALYLRVEPAWKQARFGQGWLQSRHQLQMRETYTIDLNRSEDEILARMDRKHRYYVRRSVKDGVLAEREADGNLAPFYEMYQQTAKRAGFGIHGLDYYQNLMDGLGEHNLMFYATVEGRPVAFSWVARAGQTAYWLYGGMNEAGAKINANYALLWQSVVSAKEQGCTVYDMNGRVSEGVSSFKRGFGPDETDWVGTWDYPLNKVGYNMWEHLWPVAKPVGRRLLRVVRGKKT
jgi:peptidoglycan pentaglycine glycine transferase (the first glycine)